MYFLHGETNPRYSSLFSTLELEAIGSVHQRFPVSSQEAYILVLTKVNVNHLDQSERYKNINLLLGKGRGRKVK